MALDSTDDPVAEKAKSILLYIYFTGAVYHLNHFLILPPIELLKWGSLKGFMNFRHLLFAVRWSQDVVVSNEDPTTGMLSLKLQGRHVRPGMRLCHPAADNATLWSPFSEETKYFKPMFCVCFGFNPSAGPLKVWASGFCPDLTGGGDHQEDAQKAACTFHSDCLDSGVDFPSTSFSTRRSTLVGRCLRCSRSSKGGTTQRPSLTFWFVKLMNLIKSVGGGISF